MGGQEPGRAEKHICAGLLAHVDAGKTTLSEAILYLTGAIRKLGRVDNKDALLDNYEVERARGITVFSKSARFLLDGKDIALLDTPGHVDFSAEMERTLQVLDYAVLVISGTDGVQGHTETLWRLMKLYHIPCFLFINKMDQAGTDRGKLMAELKKRLDVNCVDFTREGGEIPAAVNDSGRVDMRSKPVHDKDSCAVSGDKTFMEEIATCDEEALEAYLESGIIQRKTVRRLIAERRLFPCYFGSALKLFGVEEFLSGLGRYAPAPDYGPAFGAKVYKISRDAQGNRLTHLKITGGSLKTRDILAGKEEEKVNQIRLYSGAKFEVVQEAVAGMACAVTGPMATYPGQGLGIERESEQPVLEPVLGYRLILPPDCDARVMYRNLKQLEEEEPELHIVWEDSVGEILVKVMGAVQMEVLKGQIFERFQTAVDFGAGHIVYKETIAEAVEGVGHFEPLRHYAEVHLWMEPAERGTGLQFASACSEDVLEKNWQRLVMTHLKERAHKGTLIGAEITDMKITLIAGRAHLKHTEGGDFRQATYRAVRQGLREAGCRLLEPCYRFHLQVPAEHTGRAMTDLERMKASFEILEQDGTMSELTGVGPVSTMWEYQTEVTAYTKGRGRLNCIFAGYELCHNEAEVAREHHYDPEADLENPTGSVFCAHGAGFVVPWDQVKAYMQVESPMADKEAAGQSHAEARQASTALPSPYSSDDDELEAIFIRTYGEPKRRPLVRGRKEVVCDQADGKPSASGIQDSVKSMGKPGYMKKGAEKLEEYLLVDGYNIIYAWEELSKLAKTTLESARRRLMDILCNYQGYKKMNLILVFDAYKVAGNIGQAIQYHNIHVIYTKEAETADQYIEKLAHEMGRKCRVTVATSDAMEQLIIRGQGCLLMSAKELKEEIEETSRQIEEERKKLQKPEKTGIFSQVDEDTAKYLKNA